MTKIKGAKFLSGLNVQQQQASNVRKISVVYPQIGTLVIVFILSFVGSFKSLVWFDNKTIAVSQVSSNSSVYDTTRPEVLAFEITEEQPHIGSVETKVTTTPIPEPTATNIPTPEPTVISSPRPTFTPTPTRVPQVSFSDEEIMGFIERFAAQYSLDPNVLRYIATCESGFDQHASNGPYVGLFQFGTSAWVTARAKMGEDAALDLRLNAEESIQTASFLLADGRDDLWPNCMP